MDLMQSPAQAGRGASRTDLLPGSIVPESNPRQIKTQRCYRLPNLARVLMDEIRELDALTSAGLILPEEAEERLSDWEIVYSPGWSDIEQLADARRA